MAGRIGKKRSHNTSIRRCGVVMGGAVGAFVAAAERVMARPRTSWLAQVDKHLATMSWDQTWAAMHALIEGPEAVDLELQPLVVGEGLNHV